MRWRTVSTRLLFWFSVLGPGFITANVNNEAGGIFTYSFAGAQFGYGLLWTLIPMSISLIVIQEMCSRLGAITGKGLSDLIREEFGLRTTFLIMTALILTNLANVVAEFSGVAASLLLFGIPKYVSVPIAAVTVWLVVVKGDYKSVEKIFITASLVYISYVVAGVLSDPEWKVAFEGLIQVPQLHNLGREPYLYMVAALIGATISPWMQFYQQSAVVEKGIGERGYKFARLDVWVGSLFSQITTFFIIVACAATIYKSGMRDIRTAADAAIALKPFAGEFAFMLFAIGLFNASLFAASILPLSTAYSVCEGLGFESGTDKRLKEAPFFYALYGGMIAVGAGIVLWPDFPLLKMTVLSQVLNAILLPVVLIAMIILVNRTSVLGEYVNSKFENAIVGLTTVLLIALTLTIFFLNS